MQTSQIKTKRWSKKDCTPSPYQREAACPIQDPVEWIAMYGLEFAKYFSALIEAKQEGWKFPKPTTSRISYRQKQIMARLESAAESGNELDFLAALKELDLDSKTAADFVKVIRLARKAGAYLAAREISIEGLHRFPDNLDIQKRAKALAPPKVISRNLPPEPTLEANR